MARLAAAMQIQQMRPMRMGLAPDFTSFTRSVFSPMAARLYRMIDDMFLYMQRLLALMG